MGIYALAGLILVILFLVAGPFVTVAQGTVAVVTMFGKYRRVMGPGLNIRIPLLEQIFKRVSIQNQSVELEFHAITQDQANVHFKSMLLYAVLNQAEETIKNVAYKFIDKQSFMTALTSTVEGSVRSFVATKRQSEILLLRRDIVDSIKLHLDTNLESWGYHLIDLQINDIAFGEEIMRSMEKVVASSNLKAAAENLSGEGWKWIAVATDFPYGHTSGLRRLVGQMLDLNDEERTSREALRSEMDRLEHDYADADELPDEVDLRLGEIETALDAFEGRPMLYDPAEIARAGAFVSLDQNGEARLDTLIKGDTVREVLDYVEFDPEMLLGKLRTDVETAVRAGRVDYEGAGRLLRFYEDGLHGYTYLEG